MNIPFRPLGKVREIVQSTRLDIAYAYDDLVFSDHSLFIIRFDDNAPGKLYLHFNRDCNPKEVATFGEKLITAGKVNGFDVITLERFEVRQLGDKEEIELKFL